MIPVTKTFFPPLEDYENQLKRIWQNEWLTNRGALVKELEKKLKIYLDISNITLTTNGTLPIQIALKGLAKQGEVITTPFSYVATTSSIVWENCKPVFVDIHPDFLTIDESKIEAAITEQTTAILATHVFGNPCNVEVIEGIAHKYNLKVIYDSAHAFGVKYKGNSILEYGDVNTISFHATKIFHTGEGGAFICKNETLHNELFFLHNFGHNGPSDFHGVGINAKMSELQAAMGLSVLPHMEYIFRERKRAIEFYETHLNFSKLGRMVLREDTNWNYSYYPIIFDTEKDLLKALEILKDSNIFPRRYFYPSLNTLNYVDETSMKISESIAKRIVCLPLYTDLSEEYLSIICNCVNTIT